MPEELRPDKSKVVVWVTPDGKTLIASVDPNRPNAYKEGEMGRLLQVLLQDVEVAQIGIIVGKDKFPLQKEWDISVDDLLRVEKLEGDTDSSEGKCARAGQLSPSNL
jgi:hypothetical protein